LCRHYLRQSENHALGARPLADVRDEVEILAEKYQAVIAEDDQTYKELSFCELLDIYELQASKVECRRFLLRMPHLFTVDCLRSPYAVCNAFRPKVDRA
jgi:hypothetical protein